MRRVREPGGFERSRHAHHGAADDVGGGALDRRVDRGAFEEAAHRRVLGVDLGIVHAPAEHGLDVAVIVGEFLGRFHVVADAGEALEVGLDVLARLLARNAELVGQPERRDAVDDAEVDRLGAPARLGRHVLDRHAEHFRRRHGVNVEAVGERLLELRNVGDVGEHAQLDLAVVGGDQLVRPSRR